MMWSTQIKTGRSLNRFEEKYLNSKSSKFPPAFTIPRPGSCLDTNGLSATFYWVFNSYSTPSAFGHEEYSHIQSTEEILSLSPHHFQYSINPSIYAINQLFKNLNTRKGNKTLGTPCYMLQTSFFKEWPRHLLPYKEYDKAGHMSNSWAQIATLCLTTLWP